MTEGVVTGGWGFVQAAYALTFGAFIMYGISIVTRLRKDARTDD